MRPHPRGAETDASNPRGWGTCDRCGFVLNLFKLRWQYEWRGVQLYNIRILVCEYCEDTPQRQLGTIFIPPDPPPLLNARVEQYGMDEAPGSVRYTIAGAARITIPVGPLFSLRVVSGNFQSANPP